MLKKVLIVAAGCFALGCTSAQAQDLALNRPATASSTQIGRSEFQPTNANDGNSSTRWSSEFVDNQWWQVDLGSDRSINRVELNWEVAYARQYRIRTRTATRHSWSTAATVRISSAGLKTHTFATTRARYVRIHGDVRATPWGISLWDLRVCNMSCSGPPPPTRPDADGDGVPDSQDQCPNQPGQVSNNGCPVPPPSGEPAPIAGQGYTKVFEDNFDTYNTSIWSDDTWYENDDPPDAKFVQNGVLNLVSRRSQGYPDIYSTTDNTRSWQQGYMEARMRWTGGQGAWPAFWMLSQGWRNTASCHTPAAEIDIMEGQGSQPNVFYGAIHRHSGSHVANCGTVAHNTNNTQPQSFRLADNWRTYAVKWTADEVCWYLENVRTHCWPTYDTTDNSPMFMLLSQSTGGWMGNPDSTTPDVLRTEFDWVRVWQR
jgi:F5/8 type C domain/Glycosyl hydrolases family 16